ncbi:unnamed protein product [Brassica rapa subsp. narinosa]
MWLPKLDYGHSYCSEPESSRLRRFLDHNLPLHRAPVIESFRLELVSSRFKRASIKMWVAIAVSHCLRELNILYESKLNILPSNLFTCKSLVILKLAGGMLLNVPRMVSLPSLKTLKLQRVKYFKGKTLQRLLSNCPVLEDLVLDLPKDSVYKIKRVWFCKEMDRISGLSDEMLLDVPRMVSLPSLKTLKLHCVIYFDDKTLQRLLSNCPILEDLVVDLREHDTTRELSVVVPSLQSLSLYLPCNNVTDGYVIETPSLKYFKLTDHNPNDHYCLIENMPHLVEAYLDAMYDEGFVFDQLEHLEVCICKDHFPSQLIRLLKASSNLQGLHIFFIEDVNWNQPSTVPECMLSSLQNLSWSMYKGEPQEKDIMIYILEHALHLKTATIKSSSESDILSTVTRVHWVWFYKDMDIISGLSDDLLIKILLLVPTKVAVSTSILSKRWEYLWMWLPKLQYGHRREPEWENLRCFLDRNLPLHRAPVIESFRLELCNTRFKPESINMWVVVALSHCLRA